jgi:hypothetical protein
MSGLPLRQLTWYLLSLLPLCNMMKHPPFSHLATLRNDNVLCWLAFWVRDGTCVLDLGDHVHALDNVPEDDVLAVQMRRSALGRDDEELATIRVRTVYSQCMLMCFGVRCSYPLFY